MEETNKFVKNTMAARLHENDEGFNIDEVEVFGDELVRWLRRGGTLQGGQWPDGVVDTLDAWLEGFLPQAECLEQLATELSTGLSHEKAARPGRRWSLRWLHCAAPRAALTALWAPRPQAVSRFWPRC